MHALPAHSGSVSKFESNICAEYSDLHPMESSVARFNQSWIERCRPCDIVGRTAMAPGLQIPAG